MRAAFIAAVALGIGVAAAKDITSGWAGHYERHFENGLVSGERYMSGHA